MNFRKRYTFLLLFSILLFDSCSRHYRHPDLPSDQAVSRLSSDSMKLVNRPYASFLTGDDLPIASLQQAIEKTLLYYERIPGKRQFRYGSLRYSAKEVAISMRLFLSALDRTKNRDELVAELQKTFYIFESIANREDQVMLTGYYEPIFKGSLQRSDKFNVPIYGLPKDLRVLELEKFRKSLRYRTIVFRMKNNKLTPYHSREEIMEQGVLSEKAKILAWMQDPIDLFFLQVQGSGILVLPSGKRLKLSYAGSNGRPYSSIGKLLVEEERLLLEEVSMGRIREYLNTHPHELKRVLYHNFSYTFFHVNESEEHPRGSLNVPLTPHRSIAMDVTVFPKGSLGYLAADLPDFNKKLEYQGLRPFARFIVSQDTGGAIKGPGRVDVFWGNGAMAEKSAGMMRTFGKLYFIIAKKEILNEITGNSPAD